MKLIRSFALAFILALSLLTLPVSAANLSGVVITTNEPEEGGPGTFTISAEVAASGLICSGGTVTTSITPFAYTVKGNQATYTTFKHFVCGDGSGSFTIEIKTHAKLCGSARWDIVSRSGAYAAMWGSGKAEGPCHQSVLTGNLHFR